MTKLSPYLSWTILWGLSLIAGWHSLAATYVLASQREEYTHILLIAPVVFALFYLDWQSLKVAFSASVGAGSLLLAISLLVGALARWNPAEFSPDVQLSVSMLALVGWWIGSFVLCFGVRAARPELFPLCFLLWLVPWPVFAVDGIIAWLQHASAFAARVLFVAARVPVTQDGLSLILPGLTLNVAPECSSIRSSALLMVTTMLLAHLFLRSPWRKLLVIAAVVPLSAAKNGLRIFTLGFLATRVDPSYLDGRLHHQGGVIFLAIAETVIIALLWLLRRGEQPVMSGSPYPH